MLHFSFNKIISRWDKIGFLVLMYMRKELEKRLINLAISIDKLSVSLRRTYLAQHLITQLIRSSTSAALNYGEAQAAESKKDFIHKVSLVLKELKETKVSLKILEPSVKVEQIIEFKKCLEETDQLVAIFYQTIKSARQNTN